MTFATSSAMRCERCAAYGVHHPPPLRHWLLPHSPRRRSIPTLPTRAGEGFPRSRPQPWARTFLPFQARIRLLQSPPCLSRKKTDFIIKRAASFWVRRSKLSRSPLPDRKVIRLAAVAMPQPCLKRHKHPKSDRRNLIARISLLESHLRN